MQKIQKNKLDLSKRVIDGEIISQKEIDKERSDVSKPMCHSTDLIFRLDAESCPVLIF